MPLLSEITYQTEIRSFEDISPQAVLSMLEDIRAEIGKLETSFSEFALGNVLKVVEKGEYQINGDVSTLVDLSSAKEIIDSYRNYSEGGCQSCLDFGRLVLNEDMDSFSFCTSKEDTKKTPKECGYGAGFSPELHKHYKKPCDIWKPRFSPQLEKLVGDEK